MVGGVGWGGGLLAQGLIPSVCVCVCVCVCVWRGPLASGAGTDQEVPGGGGAPRLRAQGCKQTWAFGRGTQGGDLPRTWKDYP